MGEAVFFRNLTTKGLTAINSGERYFEGYLTVQVKDKQGEVTIVDELMKVLPIWIDRGAPISDTHSNRIIGKGINYSKVDYKDTDGEIYPAIKITGKIHKNYELDNDIWAKIKSGEYKGLSFGGATKSDREPMRMKDGSIAYSLKDLEHYEVAVCRDPAVPLALITEFNTLAKAAVDGEDLGGGRMLIKCDKYGCYVEKDNKEAGLKAPEARNEALVYDDKTLDQPSETPLENQAKIKKVHKLEHAKELIDDHIEEMKKGEDWSNADGDKHGMYNQDTDEGGMGKKHTGPKTCKCGDPKCKDPKCKKHKREVGTGYGAEQNADGEVQWTGSGSPYPKKKGYSDEFKEDKENWEQQKYKKRGKKKKAIITNIYSRLKSLDFLLLGQCHIEHEGTCAEAMAEESSEETKRKFKKRKKKSEIQLKNIQSRVEISNFLLRSSDTDDREIIEEDGKTTSRKKKRKEYPYDKQKDGEFGGMNTGEVEWTEPRDTANSRTKRKKENVA